MWPKICSIHISAFNYGLKVVERDPFMPYFKGMLDSQRYNLIMSSQSLIVYRKMCQQSIISSKELHLPKYSNSRYYLSRYAFITLQRVILTKRLYYQNLLSAFRILLLKISIPIRTYFGQKFIASFLQKANFAQQGIAFLSQNYNMFANIDRVDRHY